MACICNRANKTGAVAFVSGTLHFSGNEGLAQSKDFIGKKQENGPKIVSNVAQVAVAQVAAAQVAAAQVAVAQVAVAQVAAAQVAAAQVAVAQVAVAQVAAAQVAAAQVYFYSRIVLSPFVPLFNSG